MTAPRLAVVTIVRGRHAHLAGQVRGLRAQGRAPDVYVVVAIEMLRGGRPNMAPQ